MRSSSDPNLEGHVPNRQLDSSATAAASEAMSDLFCGAAGARSHELLHDRPSIALNDDAAARLLGALDAVDRDTVMRLRELRELA